MNQYDKPLASNMRNSNGIEYCDCQFNYSKLMVGEKKQLGIHHDHSNHGNGIVWYPLN